MAGKRLVMCTSTGCLEYAPERYQNLGIDIVRLHLFFQNKEYLDAVGYDPAELYKIMENEKRDLRVNLPHTSMPTPQEVAKHYQDAIDNGYDEIIFICISTGLTSCYQLFNSVAKDFEDKIKIHVINSKIVCFNEGYLAVLAQRLVNQGMETEDILKEINWVIRHQAMPAVATKLDYLIYNGRLKGTKAYVGKALNICPLLKYDDEGYLAPIKNCMGAKKAIAEACKMTREIIGDRDPKDYIYCHCYTGRTVVDEVIKVEGQYGLVPNHEDVIMTAVSGIQTGPWIMGFMYIPIRREDEDVNA